MKTCIKSSCFIAGFLLLLAAGLAAAPLTPKSGSPERKAICNAMRTHLSTLNGRPLKGALFKIEKLLVDGDYANFSGSLAQVDEGSLTAKYWTDMVFETFLKQEKDGWRVIEDLTRSDVPSEEEQKEIRKKFPKEIPESIIPEFWRKILGK